MTPAGRQLVLLAEAIAAPAPLADSDGEVFATLPIPGTPSHLLGRDAAGLVAALIAIDTSFPLGPLAPVRLENLSVLHAARCSIARPGETPSTGIYSVVRCLSNDSDLNSLFIDVIASVAQQFSQLPPAHQAAQVIDRVIRLFRDLSRPSDRTVQGLWAEMFVIATARDPVTVARAWRTGTFDTTDFATAQQRLEVKSATGTVRSHIFSADQLRVPRGEAGVVASLICQRSTGGVSIGELWSMVRQYVAAEPELLLTVDSIVAATLGNAWKEALQARYDWYVARESLRFFSMADVPAVGVEESPNISEVIFRSNLSQCTPLDAAALMQMGSLLAALSCNP